MSLYVTLDGSNQVVGVVNVPNPGGATIDEVFPDSPEYTATLIQVDDYPDIAAGWIGTKTGSRWSFASFESSPGYIDQVRTDKIVQIDDACATAILSGFTCDVLVPGKPYRYPTQATDQQNLNSSVVTSLLSAIGDDWSTLFWCEDEKGVWAYKSHNAAQIQAVGMASRAFVNGCIVKKIALLADIEVAATVEAVQAVTWSMSRPLQ